MFDARLPLPLLPVVVRSTVSPLLGLFVLSPNRRKQPTPKKPKGALFCVHFSSRLFIRVRGCSENSATSKEENG